MRALVAVLLVFASSGWAAIEGQDPRRELTDPVASFPHEFSMVSGLLELPDGRVMVADPLGQALLILDMTAGTADTLGRVGQGPAEYRQPDGVLRLPGDSTLLVDLGNGRLTVLGPDFTFGATTPIAQGSPMTGSMTIRMPQAVDSRGRIYYQRMMGRMRPSGDLLDSAAVLRWDRGTDVVDTVAMVALEEVQVRRSGGPDNQSVEMSPVPMSPRDGWAVGWDGRVAVVRSSGYHVDWVEPDGTVVSGPSVAYEPVRIRQADKEAWVEGLASSGLSIGVENVNGQITTSFRRGGRRGTQRQIDSYDWPDVMPAFRASRIRVSPDGMAWVERFVSADDPAVFDVFDQRGRLAQQVVLPSGRRIAGFGDGAIYAVYGDEYDLQWLERYER
jgi:hypothetical protein